MKVTQFKVAKFRDKWESMLYYDGKCHRVAKSRFEKVALFTGLVKWAGHNLKDWWIR